jgi:hypothetical protein
MPDIISAQLDAILDQEIQWFKHTLLSRIKESLMFQQLIHLSHGARPEDHEQLAHALLEAKLANIPIAHVIEAYAQRFIYSQRINPSVLFGKTS